MSVFSGLRFTCNLNTLKLISEIQTGADYNREDYTFDSRTFGFEPHLVFSKTISRFVGRLEVGYEMQVPGKWHLPGRKDDVLINTNTNDVLRYNGTGFRLNAGVSFLLMAPNRKDQ